MGFLQSYHARRTELAVPDSGVTPVSYRQPPAPVRMPAEPVLLPAFCTLYRAHGLIVAERHGSQLKLIRGEGVPSGFDYGSVPPPAGLGAFQLDPTHWAGCAYCGAKKGEPARNIHSLWWCICEHCNGTVLFHCLGHEGELRCVNGTLQGMYAAANPTVAVRGWRSGPAPQQPVQVWRERPLTLPAPPMLQIAAPPSATLRIGFRGR